MSLLSSSYMSGRETGWDDCVTEEEEDRDECEEG